jgi:AraC-like DNA-binding protein
MSTSGVEQHAPWLRDIGGVVSLEPSATKIHHLRRSTIEVSDAEEIAEALQHAYGANLRLKMHNVTERKASLRLTRSAAGRFAIDEVAVPAHIEASPDPLNKVITAWVSRGSLSGECDGMRGEAGPDEITVVSQPDAQHQAHAEDLAVTSVLLDPVLVATVAAGEPVDEDSVRLRFSSLTPIDQRAVRRWKETVSYVKDTVLAEDAIATPLVLGHAGRLLAAVTLEVFPNSATSLPTPYDRTDSHPVLLRRAIDFLESNLANDIGLADLADAVHVTPRAVQYMFRRHLDTTPLQYLRRLRLHHAHLDLVAGDRLHTTVTEIAARWGFAHTGRFAVLYREIYGQSPHATLRK